MTPPVTLSSRWGWYSVAFDVGKPFAQVPGVQYKDGRFLFHRTHLPLIRHVPDVDSFLAPTDFTIAERERIDNASLTLRPWQESGLRWIAPRRGVLLADEMRLGKTFTALLAHDPLRGPLVVVAPLDTRPVWAKAFARIFPDVPVDFLTGKTLELDRDYAPIVFTHYDVLTYHQSTALQPGTLILDEAHVLANAHSKRTKAVLFYASGAKRVIALSGTPLWNSSRGLWPLLVACVPGGWGKEFDFAQRYCAPVLTEHGWKYTGVSNREEWLARRSEVVLARTWKEVRPDLPPIERTIVKIPLDRDDNLAVDLAAAELAKAGTKQIDITVLGRYRQAVGKFKVEAAVQEIAKRRGPIVLWVWHKSIARLIAKAAAEVARVFVMTGDDDGSKRADTIEAWNREPDAALIATLATGQVGIDLSHDGAEVDEVFAEVDWTPAVISQAEMRPFHPDRRLSSKYLTLDHEIDDALMTAVMKKLERGRNFDIAAAGSSFSEVADEPAPEGAADLLRDLGEILLRSA